MTNKRRIHAILPLAILALLLIVPAAFADYYTSWGPINAGQAPNPWSTKTTGSSCLPTVSEANLGTNSLRSFEFISASCSVKTHSDFYSTNGFRTSSTVLTIKFYLYTTTSSWCQSATLNVNFYQGSSVFTLDSITSSSFPTTYTLETASDVVFIDGTYTLNFSLSVTGTGGSCGTPYLYLGAVSVAGADPIISGANVFLVNSGSAVDMPSNQWYNLSAYPSAYVQLGYSSSAPSTVQLWSIPDQSISLTGANLITAQISATYSDTLIPVTGSNTFYLYPPSQVNGYTVNVQDLSGTYGQGASIYLQLGETTMASGYLDASNNFQVWLPQGLYNATLCVATGCGHGTYKTHLSLPSTPGSTVQIQILKLTVVGNCGGVCTEGWAAGWNAGLNQIIFTYSDTATLTSSITDSVIVSNLTYPTGHQFYTHTWSSGPYGTLTDTISCASGNCNSTLANGITVKLTYTDSSGTYTYLIPVTGSGLFATIPNIPQSLLGWSGLAGANGPSLLAIFAYFIILISASVFGAYSAKFGVIPVACLAAVFTYAGWLPLTGGAAIFLIAMAVTAFIGYLQHGR